MATQLDRSAAFGLVPLPLRIEGMDADESGRVLDELSDIIEAPDNVYEHAWRPGDIIVRDNLSCVHARTDWPDDQRRTLRRVTIKLFVKKSLAVARCAFSRFYFGQTRP